jgi:hypothetical protein
VGTSGKADESSGAGIPFIRKGPGRGERASQTAGNEGVWTTGIAWASLVPPQERIDGFGAANSRACVQTGQAHLSAPS